MFIKKICSVAAALAVFSFAGISSANIVYTNSDLGTFSEHNEYVNLTGLGEHTELSINFDLYIYDSWDGHTGGYSPDFFGLVVDGDVVDAWSFDNFGGPETNTAIANDTGDFNSINTWGAIDRKFINYNGGFTVSHTGLDASIIFSGLGGLQGVNDESWSVKNLVVSINSESVPEPTIIGLLGTSLLLLAGISRRKTR
jgi:hypothetical protein